MEVKLGEREREREREREIEKILPEMILGKAFEMVSALISHVRGKVRFASEELWERQEELQKRIRMSKRKGG